MKSNVIKERITLNEKTRRKVFSKSNMRCARCGKPLYYNSSNSTVDHIIPLSRGGQNNIKNFIGLCSKCNGCKRDRAVLPTSYFVNMAYNSKTMLDANTCTIKWASNNVTNDYVENNPLIFDEFFYTLKRIETGILEVYTGYKAATSKHVSVYKLEDSEIEDCITMVKGDKELAAITLSHCVNTYPTYVFKNYNKVPAVESTIVVHPIDNTLCVDVIFTEHNKTLGAVLDKMFEDINPVLKVIKLDSVSITGLSTEAMDLLSNYYGYTKIDKYTIYKEL